MAGIEAVLFDYGGTLVTFEYPRDELIAVIEGFRPAIAEATGVPAPEAADLMDRVLLPLERFVQAPSGDEVVYMDVFARAWRDAGLALPEELLYAILDAEQKVWDDAARVDAAGIEVLDRLHARGVRTGLCSNAPFPPEMMLRQVAGNGIAGRVDAVVFSSEVGWRKPAPEIYLAALDALGVTADRALFVGDRVREDYDGPRAVGMRAVICTAHADSPPQNGVPTIASLAGVEAML